jgi:hypothetical protein
MSLKSFQECDQRLLVGIAQLGPEIVAPIDHIIRDICRRRAAISPPLPAIRFVIAFLNLNGLP